MSLRRRLLVGSTSIALLAACGASRIPPTLRGYDILVERGDPERDALARAFREGGFRVRRAVRGGSRPTAALVYFTFRHPDTDGPAWLHLRLADTRSGVILRAATIALDSTAQTPRGRAQAAIQAFMVQDTVFLAP
ncbi:MAG: hypothetical protein Q8Q14_05600 [Gemmatimonadales bacterium]|nr:hypothetical protein [Gemmatimonadales bacterium]